LLPTPFLEDTLPPKKTIPYGQKRPDPMDKKDPYNNINNNTKKNNTINIVSPNGDIAYGNQEINQIFEIVKKYNN
jgi:hypothetical protein